MNIGYINIMQGVDPLRCVALNTIIPLGIGILRNATQRQIFKREMHHQKPERCCPLWPEMSMQMCCYWSAFAAFG